MEEKVTTLVTDDRMDEVYHTTASKGDLMKILEYILMDYKKINMTDKIMIQGENGQIVQLQDGLSHRYLFLVYSGIRNSRNITNARDVRFTYQYTDQVLIEKYRNGRKTESIKMSLDKIQQLIQSFENSTGAFLSTNVVKNTFQFVAPLLSAEEVSQRTKVKVKGGQLAFAQLERKNKGAIKNYTAEEVSKHNKVNDAWTVLNGKIYDITLYAEYHPGGAEKLLLGAGKDCTKLFNQFHPWVNGHAFLEKDYIGNLKQ